ncbi:MAG: hypothetical protein QXT76_00490 [Sulfolobales archaeon]
MLKREDEVRKTLEDIGRRLKKGESVTIEVSESILEFAVSEAIKQKLSVVDAYEKEDFIVLVVERRHY